MFFPLTPGISVAADNPENTTTLYVGGTGEGNYTSIQSAINNISNEGTVFVYNGDYFENISIKLINKTLNLVGESKENTIIHGACNVVSPYPIYSIYIENFNFTGKKGVAAYTSSNIHILNCAFYHNIQSIYFNYTLNSSIQQCRINQCFDGVMLDYASSNNIISNNEISYNDLNGISICDNSNNNIVSNNTVFSNTKSGIWIVNSSYTTIKHNKIYENQHGINLVSSSHTMIKNNSVFSNKYVGIVMYGILNITSHTNTLTQCNLSNNPIGVALYNNTINILVFYNNFINNTYQAYDFGQNNHWNSTDCVGNYWSDHPLTDDDNDGVCDVFRNIPPNGRDFFPSTKPFGLTNEEDNNYNLSQTTPKQDYTNIYILVVVFLLIIMIVAICVVWRKKKCLSIKQRKT